MHFLPDPWYGYFLIIRFIFIVLDIVLAVGFVYSFAKAWHFHPTYKVSHHGAGGHAEKKPTMRDLVMKERWKSILTKFDLGTPDSARLAIIEADALVDTVLKGMQIPGEHLADRLSNLDTTDMKSVERLWRAHRVRNDLVHTPGYGISPTEAEKAMKDYQAFLKELEVID